MAWIEYQPNPLRTHGNDCTVRAISKAMDIPWDEAYWLIAAEGYICKDVPSTNDVWGAALRRMGFKRHNLPQPCPDCYAVEDFAREHPEGTYILCTGSHVVALVDGDWYDSWNSGDEVLAYCYAKEEP